ncbi:MAG: class I SAM-dependent methyltransferase [Candidatus Thorarchaeota archaeon]
MNRKPVPPHERTLDAELPELKSYLSTGMNVLDVGCGLGTITLNVAEIVKPGNVIGIDPFKNRIDAAQAWADANPQLSHVNFHVGDSHHLEFPDDTFDLVFSHTVMHFFFDPVHALREQKRVTKKGGWVIASGVRDMSTIYPYSPNWEQVYDAWRRFYDSRLESYRASGQDPITYYTEQSAKNPSYIFYYNFHGARQCMQWFHQVGLTDVQLMVQPRRVRYQGHTDMKPWVGDWLALETRDDDVSKQQAEVRRGIARQFKLDHQRMIDMGLLDEETLELAKAEAWAFYRNPGAFQFWLEVFAAGRVP